MFKKNWGPIKLAGVDKQKMTERTVIKDIYKKTQRDSGAKIEEYTIAKKMDTKKNRRPGRSKMA